jgi:hypothetical protein
LQDDESIRTLWASHTGKEIAATLGKDYKRVMARATKLGLRKHQKKAQPAQKARPTDTIGMETNMFIDEEYETD